MAAEKIGGGSERGSERASGNEEMNGNSSSKVVVGGGYRWSGDAVPLKRRRVGLSNGGSVSDAGSSEEEEEEEEDHDEDDDELVAEEVEVAAEESSEDDDAEGGEVGTPVGETIEDDDDDDEADEEEDDDEHLVATAPMDRGGSSSGRGRQPVGFDDHDVGMEDDGYDDEPVVPDSPVARRRGRERAREMSSPEEGRDVSDDSDDERAMPISRGISERGQSSASETHREVMIVPEKPARGMMDTAKRKPEVTARNGGAPKPKKERAPAAPRRKANGEGTRERTRFSTDNKARVTLERAREILAAVKAAMMKDPKHYGARHSEPRAVGYAVRHSEPEAVDNSSSSEDERVPMQPPSRVVIQQVKAEEKVVKKRSRAPPKAGKEPTPRRRKPKLEIDYQAAAEEKPFYRRPHVEGSVHDHAFKVGHFSGAGVQVAREGRDVDDREVYVKKESRVDGYEQQKPVVEKKVRKRKKAKDAKDGPSGTGLCPGSLLRDENWSPPASPFGLIQESLYKDPWKVLLSCMLLNKTAGRQMHKVIWDLFSLCPDAETAINMDTAKIAEKVYSLGLQNKRAKMIQRFSLEYLRGDWTNVTQLHGIGKYAADAYAIFCQGLWREVEPDDHQLTKYWKWLWETDGLGTAFTPDTV